MKPIFTISLDFELHWGGFEKWPVGEYTEYFNTTRHIIPQLLKAFERSGVHATWATVGLLLHKDEHSLKESLPEIKPTYGEQSLSAYHFLQSQGIGTSEDNDPLHYAHTLVQQIVETSGQELASHSFAHYYCNEPGQNPEQFKADAIAWNSAAEKYGITARSLVFPRNQFNQNYLKICKEVGLHIVRSNPIDWWWNIDSTQRESKWKRLNRGLDAYFNIGGKTSYHLNKVRQEEGVWLLPASRLLRPFRPQELLLNSRKIRRIKKEMTLAAQQDECYHLWWHPHNFARHPKQNMEGLIEILNHYQTLHRDYHMMSYNMVEISQILNAL